MTEKTQAEEKAEEKEEKVSADQKKYDGGPIPKAKKN